MDSSEDSNILDSSTAPTTPEGSYMSSPILCPQTTNSLAMGLGQSRPIRNICCVGAGYVGKNFPELHVEHSASRLTTPP